MTSYEKYSAAREALELIKVMIYRTSFMDEHLDSFSFSYLNICDCAFPSRLFDFAFITKR